MLRNVKDLREYAVSGVDGDIGKVKDFYFDDTLWTIRYLVVDTAGFWEASNQVLISPIAFRDADYATNRFHLSLTKDKIRHSPSVDLDKPVSRQFERRYFQYYDWPFYWGYGGVWGPEEFPAALAAAASPRDTPEAESASGDPNLRSVREVTGYHIKGLDEEVGHVKDFIVDDQSWTIRYLVVDTSNWWFGRSVLLAPEWIDHISWEENLVYVKLPRELIKQSPEWEADRPIGRDYESRLYEHYGRPSYWNASTKRAPSIPTRGHERVGQAHEHGRRE
ncbi:MAG: PRC-barrel domain-containing protein [Polyangiaceae bacterium]